jgi:hypothetical protein
LNFVTVSVNDWAVSVSRNHLYSSDWGGSGTLGYYDSVIQRVWLVLGCRTSLGYVKIGLTRLPALVLGYMLYSPGLGPQNNSRVQHGLYILPNIVQVSFGL